MILLQIDPIASKIFFTNAAGKQSLPGLLLLLIFFNTIGDLNFLV
jgi:hypothetical protein